MLALGNIDRMLGSPEGRLFSGSTNGSAFSPGRAAAAIVEDGGILVLSSQ